MAFGCPLSPRLPLWLPFQHGRCQPDGAGVLLTHPACCAALGSGCGSPTPPSPGFIQSEAKTCCNLRGRGDNGREHGTKWLRVASWCVWGCYSCSWAEDAFPGAGCPRSVLITWDLRDSSGCFRARPFSLERSGSDGLPCPWTRFKGQATTAQEKLGEISDLNPPIPHPQNCPLYRKHKSGSVWTLSSAFTKK